MRIDYKIQDKFDFYIFVPVLLLMVLGLVAIYSSTYNHPTMSGKFENQLFWSLVSLTAFFIVYFLPYNFFRVLATPSYLVSLFFLIVVLFAGSKIKGASSWFRIGSIGVQPSEFAKIGTILFLSYFLSNIKRDINNFKDILFSLAIGGFPIILIILQPDMGTAIVFVCITLALIFWRGISLFSLFVVLSPGVIVFASMFGTYILIAALLMIIVLLFIFKKDLLLSAQIFVLNLAAGFFFDFIYALLKPHQQKRIEAFLDPTADPLGSGYNITQAQVAIGSGGLLGKGILAGNQTQNRFIPEQWTDFIYCVIGEEMGFIGSMLVVVLFLVLFLRLLQLTKLAKDHYSSLILVGVLTLLFVHFSINVGMNLGVAPVIGLPLPFLSYGGTSLFVNMILIGISLNIYRNRKIKA